MRGSATRLGQPQETRGAAGAHLGGEVVLLELPPFPQIPGAHGVVQTPRPQLRTVMRDVYAAGTVRVALELPLNDKMDADLHGE